MGRSGNVAPGLSAWMRASFQVLISPRKIPTSVALENRSCSALGAGAAVGAGSAGVGAVAAVVGAAAGVDACVGAGAAASVAACVGPGVGEAIMIIGATVGAAVPGMPQLAIDMAISSARVSARTMRM